ncbi:MAG TPA: RNA polymerase sigma factor [Phycisphaerae bacterium]|jgi:RNA polymerase sigma-70 factor (ECF subfamily)
MVSDDGAIAKETLEEQLLARARSLCDYIDERIPSKLRGLIEPEDVLQNVWMEAFNSRQTFRQDTPRGLDRWLMTIADHSLLDMVRLAQALKRGQGEMPMLIRLSSESGVRKPLHLPAPGKSPSRVAAYRETVCAVQQALNTLPDDYRLAVYMRLIEERPWTEIAAALRLSLVSAKTLVFDGMRELRGRLGHPAKYFTDPGRSRTAQA